MTRSFFLHHGALCLTVVTPLLGCESNEGSPPLAEATTGFGVVVPGPYVVTNFKEPMKVIWSSPARDVNKRYIPDAEMRDTAMKLASVVEQPSGRPVPGKWVEGPDDFNAKTIVFEREGEPSGSWEAVVLDGSKMPKEFGGASHVGLPVVYSPVSRPVVSFVNVARMTKDEDGRETGTPPRTKGNDLVNLAFSEEVVFGDQQFTSTTSLEDFVELGSSKQDRIDCKPSWNFAGVPGPNLKGLVLECPPFGEGDTITIHLKRNLASPSGVSLNESYSLSGADDVTIEVTIPGPDAKEPATPREVDNAALLEQAGVPMMEEK